MKRYCSFILLLLLTLTGHAESWKKDASEAIVGIHLLSDYGSEYQFLSQEITEEKIREEINKLDWSKSFNQFVVVKHPGVSMEVGGSINPVDGLSAMYRDRHNKVDAVIATPPATVDEMAEILVAFIKSDDSWKKKYEFEFTKY